MVEFSLLQLIIVAYGLWLSWKVVAARHGLNKDGDTSSW